MSKPTAKQVSELEAKIRFHQRLYYDLNEPEISDADFDILWEQLKELAPDSPVLNERSQFDADYKHEFPMGSLDKCKTPEEVVRRLAGKSRGNRGTISAKLDGSSLSIDYDKGRFVRAVTRGRSETGKGKIVSSNALVIPSIPKTIPHLGKITVRGECVILLQDWLTIQDRFSNPRNAASGGISCQDPRETADRKITFVAYKFVIRNNDNFMDYQAFDKLQEWGFIVPKYIDVDISNVQSIQSAIDTWLTTRSELPYWNDGIVIRLVDNEVYNELGFTGICPNGSCAYKFSNERARTVLRDIIWETGRTGDIAPVGIFDPVSLGGAQVERCTLHNIDWMAKHGYPTVGAEITVEKCGDIIPGLASVEKPGTGGTNQPTKCPSCGTPVEFDGVKISCANKFGCQSQFRGTILNALRKFEIKGMADTTLDKIIDAGLVKKPWEILDLTQDDLVKAGFGKRESEVMVESIRDTESKASHILAAIGLDMWGRRMFEVLQANNPSFTDERMLSGDFPYEDLVTTHGIGPSKAKVLADSFGDGGHAKEFLSELLKRVKVTKKVGNMTNNVGGKLAGKTFLITGTLSKSRKLIEADIVVAGGVIASGVSKSLNYLVVGEDPGSKVDKAAKLGVQSIDETELYSMI